MKIADKNHYMFYIARNITDYRIIENFQGTVVLSVNEERIRRAIASDIGSREYLLSDDVIVSAPDPKKIGKKLSEIQDSENYQYTTADHEISGFAICNEQPLAYYWKMSVSQWVYHYQHDDRDHVHIASFFQQTIHSGGRINYRRNELCRTG